MALPAYSSSAEMPTKNQFSYRYSQYTEDKANEESVVDGELERFEINVHQFKLLKILDDESSITVTALTETLGGASPWGTQRGDSGQAELIMSGASISEARKDLNISYSTYGEARTDTVSAGISVENDYQAVYFGANYEWSFNQKNTAFALGGSVSLDTLTPSDAQEHNRIEEESKQRTSLFTSVSQILSSRSIASASLTLSQFNGFLSDPYKLGDTRPDSRMATILATKYRHFIDNLNAAAHVDYRFYSDDWDMQSNTLFIAWHQNLNDSIQLIPSIRYYSQTQTSFYEPYLTPGVDVDFYSSDYRLSPYGAISKKLKLIQRFDTWSYMIAFERYESDADYAIDEIVLENPALVSFNRISLGFDYSF